MNQQTDFNYLNDYNNKLFMEVIEKRRKLLYMFCILLQVQHLGTWGTHSGPALGSGLRREVRLPSATICHLFFQLCTLLLYLTQTDMQSLIFVYKCVHIYTYIDTNYIIFLGFPLGGSVLSVWYLSALEWGQVGSCIHSESDNPAVFLYCQKYLFICLHARINLTHIPFLIYRV